MTYHWPAELDYDADALYAVDLHLEQMAEHDPCGSHEPMPSDEDAQQWVCWRWAPGLAETRCTWTWPADDLTCRICGRAESVHDGPCGSFAERQLVDVAAAVDMGLGMMERAS